MYAFSKKFKDVSDNCIFTLHSEKNVASKMEVKSSMTQLTKFFDDVPKLEISGTDKTILNFCMGASDLLIENSAGSDKIRSYEAIREMARLELKNLEGEEFVDDSHKLLEEFKK